MCRQSWVPLGRIIGKPCLEETQEFHSSIEQFQALTTASDRRAPGEPADGDFRAARARQLASYSEVQVTLHRAALPEQ